MKTEKEILDFISYQYRENRKQLYKMGPAHTHDELIVEVGLCGYLDALTQIAKFITGEKIND